MNEFVIMIEIMWFFLNKIFGVNICSCKYIIGDKEISYLNMIDDGKVTCTLISGLATNDIMLMYEYDIYDTCSLVKVEDQVIPVENVYTRDNIELISQTFRPGHMEIQYDILDKNMFCTTITSDCIGKTYTISIMNNTIRIVDDQQTDKRIEVAVDKFKYPYLFIVNNKKIFYVTDDPMRYIGSYQPRYAKITDGEVICEVGLLCNKKGDNNG